MRPWDSAAALARVAQELGVPLDDRRRELVAQEQLRMVLTHARLGTLAATLAALLLAWRLDTQQSAAAVQAWALIKVVVAILRVALMTPALAAQSDDVSRAAGWRRASLALLALDGGVWGVAGFVLAMTEPLSTAAFVAAALACVTCAATFGLQVRVAATAAYVVPILAPTVLALALNGTENRLLGAAGLLILLAMQLVTALGAQDRLAAGVLLRLQAQDLAAEREAALQLARHESEAKTLFMGKLSHELRTPLHGILGLARLLHVDTRDTPLARRVELIELSGTHLLALINDLLDVSRVRAGRFELRRDRFDLRREFDPLMEVFELRAHDKSLGFETQVDIPAPHWVQGDAARWRQVLHNLLGNALKFTAQGRVRVVLSHGEVPGMVRVAVEDTGPGIAPADQARVFQAFAQGEREDRHPSEGTGLGLTIARELARAMGGDVTVASRPGDGATFVFTARLPPADAAVPSPAGSPPSPAPHRLPQRVLIAEDDDVNATIALAYLEAVGVTAERVYDGREAVGHALRESQRPDLLLMDCRMPVLDGFDATREIRAQEATLGLPHLPVIALTAASAETDRRLCLEAGMDDFLSKPFDREAFLAVLQRWAPRN